MVGIQILFNVSPHKQLEFVQLADSLLAKPRAKGCIMRRLFEEHGHEGRFVWLERWTEAERLREHFDSDEHRTLMGAIEVLGSLQSTRVVEIRASACERERG